MRLRLYAPPGKRVGLRAPASRPGAIGPARVTLDLPAGLYRAEWIDPKTGDVTGAEDLKHAGGRKSLVSPAFDEDVALAIRARP